MVDTHWVCAWAIGLALLLPQSASAGGLTRDLRCDSSAGKQPEYVERASPEELAFSADVSNNTIFIDPHAISTRAQSVVNYEFAVACLKISGQPDDTCTVVRFMRERGMIFSDDLEVLQNYFVSRARSSKDPEEQDAFYARIKDLFSCY